jgi:hypothetical protein
MAPDWMSMWYLVLRSSWIGNEWEKPSTWKWSSTKSSAQCIRRFIQWLHCRSVQIYSFSSSGAQEWCSPVSDDHCTQVGYIRISLSPLHSQLLPRYLCSMSGLIASMFANKYPNLVDRLLLSSPAFMSRDWNQRDDSNLLSFTPFSATSFISASVDSPKEFTSTHSQSKLLAWLKVQRDHPKIIGLFKYMVVCVCTLRKHSLRSNIKNLQMCSCLTQCHTRLLSLLMLTLKQLVISFNQVIILH